MARVAACVILLFQTERIFANPDLDRFRSEGLRQLTEMEEFCRELEGLLVAESPHHIDQGVDRAFEFNGKWRLDVGKRDVAKISKPRPSDFAEVVHGVNSRYAFKLTRKTAGAPYLLTYYGKNGEGLFFYREDRYHKSIWAPWSIRHRALREWLKTDGFSIGSVSSDGADGTVKVKVGYETAKDSREEADVGYTGELTFDPKQHWSIVKADLILTFRHEGQAYSSCQYHRRIEFGDRLEGMPIPRKVTHAFEHSPERQVPLRETWHISKVARCTAPEYRFTLTAFGLPELEEGFVQERSLLWLYLLVIALFVGIGAMVMAWQAWRKRKAAAA